MEDFIVGALESALRAGEIVETIHVPAMPASAHWGYVKSCRKTGEFAHAIGAVLIDPERRQPPASSSARSMPRRSSSTNAAELFGGRIAGDYKAALRRARRRCAAGKGRRRERGASPYSCHRAEARGPRRPPHEHDRTHREPARRAGYRRSRAPISPISSATSSI